MNEEDVEFGVAIDSLVLDDDNDNKGDVPSIVESLKEFGSHRFAVCQKSTRRVGIGNHMVLAAKALGMDVVDVIWVDEDDKTFRRRCIADNATGRRAKWIDERLAVHMEKVGSDIPGVDESLAKRMHDLLHPEPKPDDPIFPVNPDPGERYDYVLVVAKTVVDVAWLENVIGMPRRKSYKNQQVGRSHVVLVEDLQKVISDQVEMGVQLRMAGKG